ncbi:hypothetical protein L2E82_38280 [Cichorium intybus]|uniref:Uncharacterized protein n=1 Tax=Cichorium intybus TaxID=13427 RepID=A0ACB9AF00_CICIN|nr:hypothetical protein L2E82_38280 [Cichorium intybus]
MEATTYLNTEAVGVTGMDLIVSEDVYELQTINVESDDVQHGRLDATYRTNKYFMVFVPFTGIDNHKKCVTFGVGLLSSESIDSYQWLLMAFKSTFGREPTVLLTDQDPAIKQAIPLVFSPSCRHRLCMWHISQKFTKKLGSNMSKTGDFEVLFMKSDCTAISLENVESWRKWHLAFCKSLTTFDSFELMS